MAAASFGHEILHGLIINMERTVRTIYGPLMSKFSPFALTFTALWVAFVGYLFLKGRLKEHGPEFVVSSLFLAFISSIVFTPSLYSRWVYSPIIWTMTSLSAFFVAPTGSGGLESLFQTMDTQFAKVFEHIETISDESSFYNLTPLVFSFIMALIFGILYTVFVLFMAIGYFGVNVMMVIGGLFIFFAGFKGTRFLFSSWLRALANYALVPVFTALVMSVTLIFIESAFADLAAQGTKTLWNRQMAKALLVGCLGIFFHLKASEFAAAITGGQPAGMMGILAMAPMAAAGLGAGLRGLGNATGVNKGLNKASGFLAKGRDAAYIGAAKAPLRAFSALRGLMKN